MFTSGQSVQLRTRRHGLPDGMSGRVVGHYANDLSYVVSFDGVTLRLAPEDLRRGDAAPPAGSAHRIRTDARSTL
jgi:hypothetical protein